MKKIKAKDQILKCPVKANTKSDQEERAFKAKKFFLVFLLFLRPLPRHMEIPRLGVESEA